MKQVLNRRSAFAALMSMMIVLSSCGQTALPGNTQVNQPGQESQTLTLSEAGQANQTRTLDVAAARGLKVESYVTLDSDAGVPTTYVAATSADGQAVTLLGGWNPGETLWLTDTLHLADEPAERWTAAPDRFGSDRWVRHSA